ncbi:hypothetical protein OIU92_31375 [Escherichia coli]|nr:hypothetical protein [Escherichia coli]
MGFRQSAAGNAWWGMGAEFYRGTAAQMATGMISACGACMFWRANPLPGGLFVDGMTGYRELSEDYTIQGDLSDLSGRAKAIS